MEKLVHTVDLTVLDRLSLGLVPSRLNFFITVDQNLVWFSPVDAQLNLPPNKYSHGLQDEVAHLVAVESVDETHESLERLGGGILPKRQLL